MSSTIGQTARTRNLREMTEATSVSPNGNGSEARRNIGLAGWNASSSRLGPGLRRLIGLAAAMTLLAVVGLTLGTNRQSPVEAQEQSRVLAVEAVAVQPVTSYQAAREYTGAIVARRTSQLGFEHAGKLTQLHVDEGDVVTAGTVLAELDIEHLETNRRKVVARRAQAVAQLDELVAGPRDEDIAAARAKVESLEAQAELLKLRTARHKKMLASGASSQDQYEQYAFGLKSVRARLMEARHNLEELLNGTRAERIVAQKAIVSELDAAIADIDVDLRKSKLTAPFDGTIARRLADDGTVVEAGQPVFRLVEDGKLEAWIGLPARATDQLAPGSSQVLKIQGDGFTATVASRFPEVDPATRTRTVVLELDESVSERVVPGQVARLELEKTVHERGFWLPSVALTKGARGLWTALVAEAQAGTDNSLETGSFLVARRELELLHVEGDRVLVRGTLNPGDRVIAVGTHRVVPGQVVRLAQSTS